MTLRHFLAGLWLSSLFGALPAAAQDMPRTVIGSAGAYFDNLLFGDLHFTVGEIAVGRYLNGMELAEGFHRVYYDVAVSSADPLPEDWQVKLYPNPATERLILELSDSQPVAAQLFSNSGQMLLNQAGISQHAEFDLSQLPAGVYWLRLRGEDGRQGAFQVHKIKR
jgi:hypothetical protein